MTGNDRLLHALGGLAILLAGATAALAWVLPDVYAADPAAVRPQLLGQDLVTLLAVAGMAVAWWASRRGSVRARVLLLGGLLYLAYTYLTYAVGARFNPYFLAYVAILATATYGLLVGVARFPLASLRGAMPARRSLAVLLGAIPLIFGALWLVDILGAYASGTIPAAAKEVQMPTSPIHVLDLGFVLPLSGAAAVLLARRSAWATPLAGIVLVKVVTICLAMLAMGLLSWREAQPVNLPVAAAAAVTLAIALALSAAYFRGLPRAPAPGARRPLVPKESNA